MHKYLIIFLCGLVVACSDIKVHINTNNSFNQEEYSSFAWLWGPIKSNTVRETSDIIFDRVLRKQLEQELISKGYSPTSKETADFLVSYTIVKSTSDIMGAGEAPTTNPTKVRFESGHVDASSIHKYESHGIYERGTLMIILENKSGAVIWQGAVSKLVEYQDKSEVQADKSVRKKLKKLLIHLPKKQKS
jgi:Domain of unknown function (DUF4136)